MVLTYKVSTSHLSGLSGIWRKRAARVNWRCAGPHLPDHPSSELNPIGWQTGASSHRHCFAMHSALYEFFLHFHADRATNVVTARQPAAKGEITTHESHR